MMAFAISSNVALRSLNEASATARGIPYTTHEDSDSVTIRPPCALMCAEPSRPSVPIPVMTTPSTRDPKTSAAE